MRTQPSPTAQVIEQYNQAFLQHDGALLEDLIGEDCVMESVEPAPNGTRVVGRVACLTFWQNLANSKESKFTVEDVLIFDDRAVVCWRFHFGPQLSQSVRGINLMRVREGLIVEALGYSKTGDAAVGTAVRDASSGNFR